MEKSDSNNYTEKTSKNASWSLFSNIFVSGISFLGTVFIARILAPHDFGVIGIAALSIGLINTMSEFGFAPALIQKRNIDHRDLSTVFISNMAVATVMTVITISISSSIAIFFHEPIIEDIVTLLSSQFLLTSIASVNATLLYKELMLKEVALIEIFSKVSRVAFILILAYLGYGVWSVIYGMIAERSLKSLFFIIVRPYKVQLIFDISRFKQLFQFSKYIYGSNFLLYFTSNFDYIITGRLLGSSSLGLYQFAYSLPHLVLSFIRDGVNPVLFPIFCTLQNDLSRMSRGYFKTVKYISILTFPLMFGLFFVAEDFIVTLYGEKWIEVAYPMQILCFSGALASILTLNKEVFSSLGRPDIDFKWSLIKLPVAIALVYLLSAYGIGGIAYAMLLIEVLSLAMVVLALHFLKSHIINYSKALLPALFCSLIMLAILYLVELTHVLKDLSHWSRLIINIPLGFLSYCLSFILIFKQDTQEVLQVIRLVVLKKT